MAHGHPDWGESGIISTVFRVADWGEIAARLGSIITYDRAGNVVSTEDFEGGLQTGTTAVLNAGSEVLLSTSYRRNGCYSLKQKAASPVDSYANWYKYVNFLYPGKLGLEWHLCPISLGLYYEVDFFVYDGSYLHAFGLRFRPDAYQIYYRDEDWNLVDLVPDPPFTIPTSVFSAFKMVVDTKKDEYVRLRANDNTYDMKGIAGRKIADISREQISTAFGLSKVATGIITIYLDDVIITQNEV